MGGSINKVVNTRTQITINRKLKSELEALARADNRSFNNYVINVLLKHVQELGIKLEDQE